MELVKAAANTPWLYLLPHLTVLRQTFLGSSCYTECRIDSH